ncbi:MAG: hypothetical protein AB7V44_25585 [Pseudonocardia sp.]
MTTPDPPTTPEPEGQRAQEPAPPATGPAQETPPAAGPAQEPASQPPRRRYVPRSRWAIVGLSVVGVLVVAAVVAAFLVPWGGRHGGFGPAGHARGGPGPGMVDDRHGWGPQGRGWDRGGEGWGRGGGPGAGLGRLGDDTLLAGTVVSAGNGTLVITPDSAGGTAPQRTLRTDDRTRVAGDGVRSLAALTAGQRVLLRVDGTGDTATVVTAFVPRARVTGTVTAIAGNQATVVSVQGLTVTVDVTAIGQKPAVGDLVEITGGASGAAIRADELRVLPKTP